MQILVPSKKGRCTDRENRRAEKEISGKEIKGGASHEERNQKDQRRIKRRFWFH